MDFKKQSYLVIVKQGHDLFHISEHEQIFDVSVSIDSELHGFPPVLQL